MPLTFNIRHLEKKSLRLAGELPVEELELELRDDMIRPGPNLAYELEAEQMEGAVLVRGQLRLPLQCSCVRCLKDFAAPLQIDGWACHLPLTGEDAVSHANDLVNLTPYVREDILLALPQHPLCEPGCGGLKLPAGVKGPGVEAEKAPSPWAELDKLKLK